MKAKYYIYRNLKTGGFSVKYKGRVVARMASILMYDVTFKVNEKGRQRVIREGQKNVHAYAVCRGYESPSVLPSTKREITYNPYARPEFFMIDTRNAVHHWNTVYGINGKLFLN